MKRLLVLLVLCGAMFGVLDAQGQVPAVLGVWELNNAASDLPAQLFPQGLQSEIRNYYQRADGYLVVLALRVNGNGIPDFIQVTAKSDGQDYPQYQSAPLSELTLSGTPTPFTYSETLSDDHTAQIVGKRGGQVINKGSRKISDDGMTMTLNVVAVLPDGQQIPIVLIFDKRQ